MKRIIIIILFSVFGNIFSQTNISGSIFTNQVWDAAGSPYLITGNVVFFQDLVLEIRPGTELRFNGGASIEMRGYLRAYGTEDSMITFKANYPTPYKGYYKGFIFKNVSNPAGANQVWVNYVNGESADKLFDLNGTYSAPYIINNSVFTNNRQVNYDNYGNLTYYHCEFANNSRPVESGYSSATVESCSFHDNKVACAGYTNIYNSIFFNNGLAADGALEMFNCEFYNNDTALYVPLVADVDVENNHIHDNYVGFACPTFGIAPNVIFKHNKICNNTYKNLIYTFAGNGPFQDNCWCSTDSVTIHSGIIDGYTNASYGLVRVFPLMNSASCLTIGMDELASPSFQFYPNPANDFLNIIADGLEGEIKLYDLNGKCLKSQLFFGNSSQMLDVSGFSAGMYVVSFQTSFGRSSQKLIIEK